MLLRIILRPSLGKNDYSEIDAGIILEYILYSRRGLYVLDLGPHGPGYFEAENT